MLARTREQAEILPWRSRAVRFPGSLAFEKRDTRPISEMDCGSPVALRGASAGLGEPNSPLLRGNGRVGRSDFFEIGAPDDVAVNQVPQGKHRENDKSIHESFS